MKTQTVNVDAKKAQSYLDNNKWFQRGVKDTNRQISIYRVNRYAWMMLQGNWKLTHQGIGFDTNGHLEDGQHRLLAIIQASEKGAWNGSNHIPPNPKISVQFNVTWGLDPDAFKVIDSGYTRTASQILGMAGHTNTPYLASSARLLYMYDNHKLNEWGRITVPSDSLIAYVDKYNMQECLDRVRILGTLGFVVSSVTAAYCICLRAMPDGPHDSFIDKLFTGANMGVDDPIQALRNGVIKTRQNKSQGRRRNLQVVHMAWYIKAWNDHIGGRVRTIITWRPTEGLPVPVVSK